MSSVAREKSSANVLVLYTGGTIGMVLSDEENPASPLRAGTQEEITQNINKHLPTLGDRDGIYWELRTLASIAPVDSCSITADHWMEMARWIRDEYDHWDGFVILHGTDTMAYTASGLSFLLKNLAKPVVLTGSQLPLVNERTDGRSNFANSLLIAAHIHPIPPIPEVVICFGDVLLRGNRTSKVSTSALAGFNSPNYSPLGSLGERIEIDKRLLWPMPDPEEEPFSVDEELEKDVMIFRLFPGLPAKRLETLLLGDDSLKGAIIRTFGAGNAMSDEEVHKILKAASDAGKVILNITQCTQGMVEMGLYETSSKLEEEGVISGVDMTPEAALAKMLWLLKSCHDPEEIRRELQISQRGEQSKEIYHLFYKGINPPTAGRVDDSEGPVAGPYTKERLTKALLRITGLTFTANEEGKAEKEFQLEVFVGLHKGSPVGSKAEEHRAAVFRCSRTDPGPHSRIWDIKDKIRQYTTDGHEIKITLISNSGCTFRYELMHLSLIADSR